MQGSALIRSQVSSPVGIWAGYPISLSYFTSLTSMISRKASACPRCHVLQKEAQFNQSPRGSPFTRNTNLWGSPNRKSFTTGAGASDALFRGVDPELREDVVRIVDVAERSTKNWTVSYSDFLKPPVVASAMGILRNLSEVGAVPWGGYAQAERCRIAVGPSEAVEELLGEGGDVGGVSALSISGNFLFEDATHRDYLGSILATGIDRSKVGDILVQGERGAQALVASDIVNFLEDSLTQVRNVPVQTRRIELSELRVRPGKVEASKSVEASLRLDAIASAGFKMSRSKMLDRIKAGGVRLNWKEAKGSAIVGVGDVISCSGLGRVEVGSISTTKKGRYVVDVVRYI